MAQSPELLQEEPNLVVEKVVCPIHLISPEKSQCLIYTGTGKNATHVPNELSSGLPMEWCLEKAPNGRLFFVDKRLNNKERTNVTSSIDPETGLPAWIMKPVSQLKLLGPMPCGWDEGLDADGCLYFIDHNRKLVQRADPRWGNGFVPTEKIEPHVCSATTCHYIRIIPDDDFENKTYCDRFLCGLRTLFKKSKPQNEEFTTFENKSRKFLFHQTFP